MDGRKLLSMPSGNIYNYWTACLCWNDSSVSKTWESLDYFLSIWHCHTWPPWRHHALWNRWMPSAYPWVGWAVSHTHWAFKVGVRLSYLSQKQLWRQQMLWVLFVAFRFPCMKSQFGRQWLKLSVVASSTEECHFLVAPGFCMNCHPIQKYHVCAHPLNNSIHSLCFKTLSWTTCRSLAAYHTFYLQPLSCCCSSPSQFLRPNSGHLR